MELKIKMGEGCFGPYLRIDGEDFMDMTPEKMYEYIWKVFETQEDKGFMRKLLFEACEAAQSEGDEDDIYESDSCEQCGNWNVDMIKTLRIND